MKVSAQLSPALLLDHMLQRDLRATSLTVTARTHVLNPDVHLLPGRPLALVTVQLVAGCKDSESELGRVHPQPTVLSDCCICSQTGTDPNYVVKDRRSKSELPFLPSSTAPSPLPEPTSMSSQNSD